MGFCPWEYLLPWSFTLSKRLCDRIFHLSPHLGYLGIFLWFFHLLLFSLRWIILGIILQFFRIFIKWQPTQSSYQFAWLWVSCYDLSMDYIGKLLRVMEALQMFLLIILWYLPMGLEAIGTQMEQYTVPFPSPKFFLYWYNQGVCVQLCMLCVALISCGFFPWMKTALTFYW